MSDANMTPWFPSHIKPVRRGVYPVRFDRLEGFAYWTGSRWGWLSNALTFVNRNPRGASQNKEWCGFTEKQK